MKIWIIDHYAVPPKYKPLARQTNFAKNMIRMGHEVKIFCASSVHNSKLNLIQDDKSFREEIVDGVSYVYVNCKDYIGNGVKRILNMMEFAHKLPKACKHYARHEGKPDSVLACSMTLHACMAGINIAHKYGAKVVAQYTDLWPETLISYGGYSKYHPAILYLRYLEKKTYIKADKIVFSAEGMYDYIIEQGWENKIPRKKTHYINNGVDLEWFNNCKEKYQTKDNDLDNPNIFKVVYTGSIRRVNNLGLLLDVAKCIKNPQVKILIWGDGDEKEYLEKRVVTEKIENVVFKGRVEKNYIPYIVSKADVNIMHGTPSSLFAYGISPNKLFDYMAAGKPILTDFPCKYNPAIQIGAGIDVEIPTDCVIAERIDYMSNLDMTDYEKFCENAKNGANIYEFKELTKRLLALME